LADALIVAAPSSGAGKTLITLALLRALKNAGVRVSQTNPRPLTQTGAPMRQSKRARDETPPVQ
jgi:BioD-like phosphotransacetylase family protein